jgi:hypothetical protein
LRGGFACGAAHRAARCPASPCRTYGLPGQPLRGSLRATCVTSKTFTMNTDATTPGMGVWTTGASLQGQAPNHPMLLCSKGAVVSDGEKADVIRQVSNGKMSASESPLTQPLRGSPRATKRLSVAVKTGGGSQHPEECGRHLLTVHMAAGVQAT